VLQEYRDFKPEGMFEMKEHLLALSLALLPIYWYLWHKASAANRVARAAVTSIIAVAVWWGFLTGHIINNIRGFGSGQRQSVLRPFLGSLLRSSTRLPWT
jgi:hypothetical protein